MFATASHLGRIYHKLDAIPSKLPSSKEYIDAYMVGPVYRKNMLHYLSVFIPAKNHEKLVAWHMGNKSHYNSSIGDNVDQKHELVGSRQWERSSKYTR